MVRRYPRLRASPYECFIFLGRVTSPSAKPPQLEEQFVSLTPCPAWEALAKNFLYYTYSRTQLYSCVRLYLYYRKYFIIEPTQRG